MTVTDTQSETLHHGRLPDMETTAPEGKETPGCSFVMEGKVGSETQHKHYQETYIKLKSPTI